MKLLPISHRFLLLFANYVIEFSLIWVLLLIDDWGNYHIFSLSFATFTKPEGFHLIYFLWWWWDFAIVDNARYCLNKGNQTLIVDTVGSITSFPRFLWSYLHALSQCRSLTDATSSSSASHRHRWIYFILSLSTMEVKMGQKVFLSSRTLCLFIYHFKVIVFISLYRDAIHRIIDTLMKITKSAYLYGWPHTARSQ